MANQEVFKADMGRMPASEDSFITLNVNSETIGINELIKNILGGLRLSYDPDNPNAGVNIHIPASRWQNLHIHSGLEEGDIS